MKRDIYLVWPYRHWWLWSIEVGVVCGACVYRTLPFQILYLPLHGTVSFIA